MTRLLRRVLIVLLVGVVVLAGVGGWLVVRGFPQREGGVRVAGLGMPVRVSRDATGIPHVYAASTHDLFMAQGWIHASERMWQMEIWRRIGAGRLAELFGESRLETDRFIRTLGWRRAAERDLAALDADSRAALDAYAEGVNAWLGSHGDLPLPFVVAGILGAGGGLAGYTPEAWTPLDTLTWQKVQAWNLGGNWESELFRLLADERLGRARTDGLFPAYPAERPVIVGGRTTGAAAADPSHANGVATDPDVPDATHAQESFAIATILREASSLRSLTTGLGSSSALIGDAGMGSNAWAVAPLRTGSGNALLANDPHLAAALPSLWYLIGLHCDPVGPACPYEVAGAGFPGVPGVVLGHNARIAWGLTNVSADTQDLFAETLVRDGEDAYRYLGETRAMTVREETIRVRGAADAVVRVRETVHGPLISDVASELRPSAQGGAALGARGAAYALRHTATSESDTTLAAILGVNRASDWTAFRSALEGFAAPTQAFMYADVDGHIGVQIAGRVPVRGAGDGARPAPGEDGAADWVGAVRFRDLPMSYDPPEGFIVAANNAPAGSSYPHFLGSEWDPGHRAARIRELLAQEDSLTVDAMVQIQADAKLARAMPLVELVAETRPESTASAESADGNLVRERILAWREDLTCGTDSMGCAAYESFEAALLRIVFDDELGAADDHQALARLYVGSAASREALRSLIERPDDDWWRPSRDAAVRDALERAGADLRASIGEPTSWTWGELHRITFREQTFGSSGVAPLELLFNSGPHRVPGSCDTVNAICGRLSSVYPDPFDGQADELTPGTDLRQAFEAASIPSYRLAIDLGDLDGAQIMQSTGQSGLPFDSHHTDLVAPWLGTQSVALGWSRESVDRLARQVMILQP